MALLHIGWFSAALQKQSAMNVVLPEGVEGPLPVVYQLHGLSDDYTMWHRRTAIERHADRHGVMVVMPDGARSFYCDAVDGVARYEQHLLETVAFIDRAFRTRGAAGRGIGGLSMGGFGALKLGLKHPELFRSVAAHSSAIDIVEMHRKGFRPDLIGIFGEAGPGEGDDPFRLAARPGAKPALRIDCGVDDYLIDDNRRFHARLLELGVPHEYREYPGAHDWEYWDAQIERALRFHRDVFDLACTTGSQP